MLRMASSSVVSGGSSHVTASVVFEWTLMVSVLVISVFLFLALCALCRFKFAQSCGGALCPTREDPGSTFVTFPDPSTTSGGISVASLAETSASSSGVSESGVAVESGQAEGTTMERGAVEKGAESLKTSPLETPKASNCRKQSILTSSLPRSGGVKVSPPPIQGGSVSQHSLNERYPQSVLVSLDGEEGYVEPSRLRPMICTKQEQGMCLAPPNRTLLFDSESPPPPYRVFDSLQPSRAPNRTSSRSSPHTSPRPLPPLADNQRPVNHYEDRRDFTDHVPSELASGDDDRIRLLEPTAWKGPAS